MSIYPKGRRSRRSFAFNALLYMRKLFFLFLIVGYTTLAQDTSRVVLTLDECIQTALNNNLSIQRAQNNRLIAKSNQLQSIMGHLPSINAQVNYDFFFGTTFDVNAARQVTATTRSSQPRISANYNLFNGFATHSTRQQRTSELVAAEENVEATKIQTEANIMEAYLAVLLGEENIRISQERVDFLQAQLDRAVSRESVGVGNMEEVFNFRSQLATEKLNRQTLENQYQSDKLRLLQAMRLDVTEFEYAIEAIEESDEELLNEVDPFSTVLTDIMGINPSLRGALATKEAAKFQYRAAMGQALPNISFFGMVGSNFSSNGAVNPNETVTDANGNVIPRFEPNATYFEQLGYNQFEYINFTLQIPIFNRLQTTNNIQVAKLNMINSELAVEEATQNITNIVQQIYLDLVSAQVTYQSALENMDALQQSFQFMERRYETGNTDFYTYLESLNNKNRAEIQLINAKYGIVLRQKILDVYRRSS